MQMSMFLSEEPPASRSLSPDSEKAWTTRVATWPSHISGLLTAIAPLGWSGKTSLASCQALEDGTLAPSSGGLGQLGYGWAYRVLDAQFVRTCGFPGAVPQRRRRVFVVGCLGGWQRAAAVLFDGESLRGHPPPRRRAGQGFAAGVAPSLVSSGRGVERAGETRGQDPVVATYAPPIVPQAMSSKWSKGSSVPAGDEVANLVAHQVAPPITHNPYGDHESRDGLLVAHSLRGEGFDASEDGTGRGTPLVPVAIQERAICENPKAGLDGAGVRQDGAAYTLEARTVPQAVAFAQNQRGEVRMSDASPQLTCGCGKPGEGYPAVAVPVAFDCNGTEVQFATDGSHPTLRSMGNNQSHTNGGGHAAVAFDLRGREGGAMPEGPHDTANIRAADGGSSRSYIAQPWAVRRLTPTECERLQGFPDGWTDIPWRGKRGAPDRPRYKALGNSMAVNVMQWIGERIALVEALTNAD